jgi:hypothetical protein
MQRRSPSGPRIKGRRDRTTGEPEPVFKAMLESALRICQARVDRPFGGFAFFATT